MLDPEGFTLLLEKSTSDETEMEELASELFHRFLSHERESMILLDGDLGAGKTTFTRGLAEPLGISEVVNSPTFNLMNRYPGRYGVLYHYDFYRLTGSGDIIDMGLNESWGAADTSGSACSGKDFCPVIHAVEWWDRIADLFPISLPTYMIELKYNPDLEVAPRNVRFYKT